MSEREKLCWFCKNLWYTNSHPGYSEYTPGNDFEVECGKRHWEFKSRRTTQFQFALMLDYAKQCPDFVWIEGIETYMRYTGGIVK